MSSCHSFFYLYYQYGELKSIAFASMKDGAVVKGAASSLILLLLMMGMAIILYVKLQKKNERKEKVG